MVEKHTIVSCGVKKRAKFYFLSIKGMLLCILYAKIFHNWIVLKQLIVFSENVFQYIESITFVKIQSKIKYKT